MPRPPRRGQGTTAVGEALTRAAATEGARLPPRFTDEPSPDVPQARRVTDKQTGYYTDVSLSCFGTFRRAMADLFPDEG